MRIGEAKENLRELTFVEEVGKEFHRVGAKTGNILVQWGIRILVPESLDTILDILGDLSPDFKTYIRLSGIL